VVAELAERVERLEALAPDDARSAPRRRGRRARGAPDGADVDDPAAATVVYAGTGPWEDGAVTRRLGRRWDDVLAGATGTAAVLAALGNGTRLRIVVELLQGPVGTGDLAARLDWASSGQLFHHLRELLAAGVVHQPARGTYAIPRQHVVPLLALLSAAIDVAMPTALEPAGA
jgi:DNA-binding transcriptional ArsR family regulator